MQLYGMSAADRPKDAFGRRQPAVDQSPTAPLAAGKTSTAGKPHLLVAAAAFALLVLAGLTAAFWALPAIKALDAQSAQARQAVIAIVNQPIDHLPRTAAAGLFSPGWFHADATKPDFDNVDVRLTQQLVYADYTYVTSDLNPTEMFIGKDLEFNAMTKYFYVDRSLPKARLSDVEMQEINRLYRIIGHLEATKPVYLAILSVLVMLSIVLVGVFLLAPRPSAGA